MYCYNGKALRVELSSRSYVVEDIPKRWIEMYLGGKGLGSRYLYEELERGIDPLSPTNKLIVATGPLTGTIAPLSGRFPIITKSPQSFTILDTYGGSPFGVKLKRAGYDLLIIQGRSLKPCYILIDGERVEVRNAERYWGMDAKEVVDVLREKTGDEKASVLSIGPAGENLVRFASILGDGEWVHGRGGAGAVMGSKNLKAVVVKAAEGSIKLYNPDGFKEVVKNLIKESVLTEKNLWAKTDGTPITVFYSQTAGILVTKDYTYGVFEKWEGICSERVKEILDSKFSCYSCPLACKRRVRLNGRRVKAPEYEALALLGSNTGTGKLEDVAEMTELADRLGMDVISLGSLLGLTIHLYKDGVIGVEELGGLRLDWGDVEAMKKLTKMIAFREGIGKILADGSKAVARHIKASEKYLMEVKGVEIAGYDPRGSWGMILSYATSDRGACHHRPYMVLFDAFGEMNPFTLKGKAKLAKEFQDLLSVKWSLILCEFWAVGYEEIRALLKPALNRDYGERELRIIGERVWNIVRMFNVREGFRKKDDYPSPRVFTEPLRGGKADGKIIPRDEFERSLNEYYELRGWDVETGVPHLETLKRLRITEDVKFIRPLKKDI